MKDYIHSEYLLFEGSDVNSYRWLYELEKDYLESVRTSSENRHKYFLSNSNELILNDFKGALRLMNDVEDINRLVYLLKSSETPLRQLIVPTAKYFKSLMKLIDLGSLTYLSLGRGKLSLGKLILPSIIRLNVESAFFTKENLPNLQHYSGKLDAKLLTELSHYESFRSLNLINPQITDLREASDLTTNFLGIRGKGKLTSVENISQVSGVTSMLLQDLNFDIDFQEIIKIKDLEELSIQYCNKLKNIDALLECQNLKRLRFIGCDMRAHKEIVKKFEDSDIEFTRTGQI